MLNFDILIQLLVVSTILYGFFIIVKMLMQRVDVRVHDESRNRLYDMAYLKQNKEAGAGFDVLLTADSKQHVGKLVVNDEKGWVYIPKQQSEEYSSNKNNYKKVGFVDAEGYIYVYKKGEEPEKIGYMAKPSQPNVPTIVGERSWHDLWWTSRLNVYYGDPDLYSMPEPKPEKKKSKKDNKKAAEVENTEATSVNTTEDNEKMSLSFPAKPNTQPEAVPELTAEVTPEAAPEVTPEVTPEVAAEPAIVEPEVLETSEPEPAVVVDTAIPEPAEVESAPVETTTPEVVETVPEVEEVVETVPEAVEIAPETAEEVEDLEETPAAEEEVAVEAAVLDDTFAEIPYVIDEQEEAYLQSVKDNHADILSAIRQEMIKVEGGSFMMGVNAEQELASNYMAQGNEGPEHKVTVDTFCMGKFPVTQKVWTAIMGYNNSSQINDDFPVAPVDWNECMLFVNRLNALTGLKFSLPTEAQWEFAARGGNLTNGYFFSGSNIRSNVAWDNQYSPVGKKKPNELGIYDMSGLVREWCYDWYEPHYPEGDQYNPMGPAMPQNPLDRKRVIRSPYGNETVTNRKGELPTNPQEFKSYGFRLVCEPHESLGKKVKPVLVGQSIKSGFLGGSPAHCPITDEARGAGYLLMYNRYGKNTYSEHLGSSPYGWADTAMLTSVIYTVLFLALYFINVSVFQLPLLGNDLGAILVLSAFYFVLWAVVRAVKIEAIEGGHSFQPILDLMNKSVGHRMMDIAFILLGVLCILWTFFFYDVDFIPLIMAIVLGLGFNLMGKRNSEPWEVIDPLKGTQNQSTEEEDKEEILMAPEGDVRRDYNWKLDSFTGKEIKAHIAISFNQSEINSLRHRNPFFLEKPDLTVGDYKNYVRHMLNELESDENLLYHSKYALQEILKLAKKQELNEIDTLQFVLDFIQESLVYEMDEESRELAMPKEYIRYPDELLYDQHGDCDCKSFLAMTLYYLMGYDVLLLMSKQIGHAAVGVSVKESSTEDLIGKDNLDDVTVEINGKRYYYCETTTDGFLIGDIQEGFTVDKFETRIEWRHSEDEED